MLHIEFRLFNFDHSVEVDVFLGEAGEPLVHCGEMTFTLKEWAAFHELVGYWPQDLVIVTVAPA